MAPTRPEPSLLPATATAGRADQGREAALREARIRVERAIDLASRLEAEVWEGPWQQVRTERSVLGRLVGELCGAAALLARVAPAPRPRPRRREPGEGRHPFVHEWL